MIAGTIRDSGTPVVTLKVFGRGGAEVTVEGVFDTGFDGFLCLPISLAVSLGLQLIDATRTELADGTIIEDEPVFAGQAEWDGAAIDVEVLLTRSAEVLIGTAFLNDYVVQLDYKARTVRIEKTP